jgi:hypothetical protein
VPDLLKYGTHRKGVAGCLVSFYDAIGPRTEGSFVGMLIIRKSWRERLRALRARGSVHTLMWSPDDGPIGGMG